MSMDFTASDKPSGDLDNESPMFAATPIWERNAKKKRGFGRSRPSAAAAAPLAADPLAAEPIVTRDPVLGTPAGIDPMVAPAVETEPMAAQPYTRTTTVRRKKDGVPAVAIAAGVIALGGLAAAGWYASQPHDAGVAQLTPGAPGENALAPATAPSATTTTSTTTLAANTPPPAARVSAPARVTTTTTTRSASSRLRPAASAPSASEVGVNASATLPGAPQPYSGTAATPNPSVGAPPAPVAIPSTPAVEPDATPSASPPSTTTPATPAPEASSAPPTETTPQ